MRICRTGFRATLQLRRLRRDLGLCREALNKTSNDSPENSPELDKTMKITSIESQIYDAIERISGGASSEKSERNGGGGF